MDMQPLKVGHVFVYILGLRMMLLFRFCNKGNHFLDPICCVVCTFPEVGNLKFMKTRPISGETPIKWWASSGTSGSDFWEHAKKVHQN